MSIILKGCDNALCYVDNIIAYGAMEEQHRASLVEVLRRMDRTGLQLNDKSVFSVERLYILGHIVSQRGLKPLYDNVEAIKDTAALSDITMLRSFLCMVGYYSRFIPRFAEMAEPLRELLCKGEPFV